ncbi:hypothetical protein FLM9_1224 [Candidatus Synechococcus spongiarum]|uniref:Uncharacterized protein n=1 Tax=Candidatus Synechococcus spongiarum TaxID=431041 RepID=A0A165B1G6_9SYNE|nr:hypothetical protein FLM9_1224 [Candidatus Synechococcus spongiarum]
MHSGNGNPMAVLLAETGTVAVSCFTPVHTEPHALAGHHHSST